MKKKVDVAATYLLNGLITSLFNPEKLSSSCGQGIQKKNSNKGPPLDPTKVAAMRGKFCHGS